MADFREQEINEDKFKEIEDFANNYKLEDQDFSDESNKIEYEEDDVVFPSSIFSYNLISSMLTYAFLGILYLVFMYPILAKYNFPNIVGILAVLGISYLLDAGIKHIFEKIFTIPYIDDYFMDYIESVYGKDCLTYDEAVDLINSNRKVIRKPKELRKVAETGKLKHGNVISLLSIQENKNDPNSKRFVLLKNNEEVMTQFIKDINKSVHQLFVNGFAVLWEERTNMAEEFGVNMENGVKRFSPIFETFEMAENMTMKHEQLEKDSVIFLRTKGEMFRYLEYMDKVQIDVSVNMNNGFNCFVPPDAMLNLLKNKY